MVFKKEGLSMKIAADTWTQTTDSVRFKISRQTEKTSEPDKKIVPEEKKEQEKTAAFLEEIKKEQKAGLFQSNSIPNNGTSSKIKASVPDDNVGQLAAELANGQTRFDVLQVSSKAMRAMADLRMAGAVCTGKDKEKVTQMIRRMNKLIKRIRTKLRQLEKEEQLEKRQEKAEKKKEEQKARALRNELQNKRNKRRREERDYANKEAAGGGSGTDMAVPVANTQTAASVTAKMAAHASNAVPVSTSMPAADTTSVAESVSVDISV